MSNSSQTTALLAAARRVTLAAARQTLAPPPSSIGVDWMGAALSQMEAPLPQAASHVAIQMFNSLVACPTALIGVGV